LATATIERNGELLGDFCGYRPVDKPPPGAGGDLCSHYTASGSKLDEM